MIIVSGYYGFANLGDEAILAALCCDLEALGFSRREVFVLSQNPAETEKLHGVQTLQRYNLTGIWRALPSARGFISGGGSLLQDVTSRRSIPYYLGLVELAFLRNIPVIMYGQGIGPVHSSCFRRWICKSFFRCDAYTVRDEQSAEFLARCGVPPEKGFLAADPVFQREMKLQETEKAKKIVLNLRPYPHWNRQKNLWVELIRDWQRLGFEVEFIPLGPGDAELGETLREELEGFAIRPNISLATLADAFKGARLCVSMRLHGTIFAALHDVLPIALNYDPKVSAIGAQLQVPCWDLADLAFLTKGVEELLADYDRHRSTYHGALGRLREQALINRTVLARVLL